MKVFQWFNIKTIIRIVPASVVKDIIDGKTPETFEEGKKVKIVEASWGEEKESYANGHVPGSFHINTDTSSHLQHGCLQAMKC